MRWKRSFVHRPLLALPEPVELVVGEEVGLTAIGRLLEGRIRAGGQILALFELPVERF
jgi:hypothetical protein